MSNEATKIAQAQLKNALAHFTGSETFTRHGLMPSIIMTEGVVFLAQTAGAHWLTDIVVSYQTQEKVRAEEFQVWKLVWNGKGGCVVTMSDGNTDDAIIRQDVEFTDFPLPTITLWLENNTLMLPSER